MSKFSVSVKEGRSFVLKTVTDYDISVVGILRVDDEKLQNDSMVEFECKIINDFNEITKLKKVEVKMRELHKCFSLIFEPLTLEGFYSTRPEVINSGKINDLFSQFLLTEVQRFKSKIGEYKKVINTDFIAIKKDYIFKNSETDDFYIADNDDVYSLETFKKSNKFKSIVPDKTKYNLINNKFIEEIPKEVIEEINEVWGQNAFNPALLYLFGLPFKELLYYKVTKHYPGLAIVGEKGSGKSTVLHKIIVPFLAKPDNFVKGVNVATTAAIRNIISYTNGVVIFDEYTNKRSGNDKIVELDEFIKIAYTRDTASKASRNESGVNENFKLSASFIIGGETMPSNEAVQDRLIPLTCYNSKSKNNFFTHDKKTKNKYKYLSYLSKIHKAIMQRLFEKYYNKTIDITKIYYVAESEIEKLLEVHKIINKLPERQKESLTIMQMVINFVRTEFGIEIGILILLKEFIDQLEGAGTLTERILESILMHHDHRELTPYVNITEFEFRIRIAPALTAIKRIDNSIPKELTKRQLINELQNKDYYIKNGNCFMGYDSFGKTIGTQRALIFDRLKVEKEIFGGEPIKVDSNKKEFKHI